MPLYDLYELDGAVFRSPASKNGRPNPVREVKRWDGTWEPWSRDPMKPITFGDYLGQREYPED